MDEKLSKIDMKHLENLFWPILIVLHLLGFLQALHTGSIYLVDSVDYLSQAENLIKHSSFYAAPWNGPFKPDYFTFRPPLYGSLIALIKLCFKSDYAILFFQSIISLSTIWGVKIWIRKNFNFNPNKILLGFLLLYPSQIIHCNIVMSDILFQSLIFWAFFYTHQLWQKPSYKNAVLLSTFFILAMLAKPVAYLMGISAGLIFLLVFVRKSSPKFLLPLLSIPLIYHGYCSYNQQITGHYHYSTVTPIFVLKYMGKYTNTQVFGEQYADSVQEEIMNVANQLNLKDRYHFMNESGKKMILAHPTTFLQFNVKGWIAFMVDPGRFEWVHFLNLDEGSFLGLYHVVNTKGLINGIFYWLKFAPLGLISILIVCLLFNLVVSYLFLRFLFDPKYPMVLRIMLFLFVGYIIGATGVLGLSRYRIGVAPFIWIAGLLFLKSKSSHVNH
jgi:hypothetical protein